jgi:hypothetical protein
MENESLPHPPVELLDLATGYQRSKTLFALVEFGLPTVLAGRALSLDQIARSLGIHQIAADRFLNACVALRLLDRAGTNFSNTVLSETFLVKGKTAYLGDQLRKYDQASYPNWTDLPNKLRNWLPGATDNEPPPADQAQASMSAQDNLSLLVGHALGQAYDFSIHQKLLDLGGGTGAMSLGICQTNPNLSVVIYELPTIAEVARKFVRESEFADRIEVQTGNFKEDELPTGFDVVLLANLLSTASEETNRELLRRLYRRLPYGGAVILSGWILDDTRTSPLIPVLFCLEDINWQAPDVERSASTYRTWMEEAGFVEVEREIYCPPTSMIVGRKRVTRD